jgi:phage baseplate assembly protein gpV
MADNPNGYLGQQSPYDSATEFNALSFLVNQIMNGRNVATLVQIKAVTNAGGLAPVGYVDVIPLVNQLDGYGNATPHGVVHNLPYFRMQGGANAIILDPQVGDIGIAVFADRDISSVKASKKASNPSSRRRADYADGMYIGGFLNGVPAQYVQFSAAGIKLHSPTQILLDAPDIKMTCATAEIIATASLSVTTPQTTFSAAVTINGMLTFIAGITGSALSGAAAAITGTIAFIGSLTSNGKAIDSTHTHSGVQTGSGNSGPPV